MLTTISQEEFFGGPPPQPTPDQARRCLMTPWIDLASLLRLCDLHRPSRFLEVGCHRGATTLFLAEAFPEMAIVVCDPGDSVPPPDRNQVQRNEYLPQASLGELVRGRENVSIHRCGFEDLPVAGKFDGLFIDGDHRFEAVKADTARALSMRGSHGFIAWHDVGNEPTPEVELALASLGLPIVKIEGTWLAYLQTAR
ncbi:MAG TPA: class I SAM-dependent methyltransferase [Pirellulales bacterium]|jgi:predicted O-methyltransferase YrrM|nr:class I SAM-dependent methyltransferase [Pirellulales bacterium]